MSAAISGSTAIVRAPFDNNSAPNAGATYLFDTTTGAPGPALQKTPAIGDQFGLGVGISGSIAIVGAPNTDVTGATDAGAAYLFDATTGALLQTLQNPDPADFDEFGLSVGISGTTAIVGAPSADVPGAFDAGAAYLFSTTTGALLQTLQNPTPADVDQFGWNVAIDGGFAVVGTRVDDDPFANSGAVHVIDVSTGGWL